MSDRALNPWQEAIIESIVQQTPTVKSLVFRPRYWPAFLPGQHIDVRLTAPDGYEARRSYSITSAPGDPTFELAVERLSDGEVSPFFHDVALVGDAVEIAGPFTQHFVWRPESDGAVLLIGGGSGMAPFMSMLRARATTTAPASMTFVYSARSWDDIIFRDELLQMESVQHALRIVFVLTRSAMQPASAAPSAAITQPVNEAHSHRLPDYTRRIDAAMLNDIIAAMPSRPATSFVCGNNGFVGTVADALVAWGLAPAAIKTERYGE